MGVVRFIADLHLGHKGIVGYSGPERGGVTTTDEHDQWIVDQWNSVCNKGDTIWILGDVCMDIEKLPLLAKMKGTKKLILGNHDEFPLEEYAKYFDYIHGFEKYKGFWLSHAPIHPEELRGKINVHGHVHHKIVNDPRYICVCVEQVNGLPVSLDELRAKQISLDTSK